MRFSANALAPKHILIPLPPSRRHPPPPPVIGKDAPRNHHHRDNGQNYLHKKANSEQPHKAATHCPL
jgi:hypothetical protein